MFECRYDALLPFKVWDLYMVVMDVESYPAFLPKCHAVEVLERGTHLMIVDVTLKFKLLKISYLSKIYFQCDQDTAVVEIHGKSPFFKDLYSKWDLEGRSDGTHVEFYNKFEISKPILCSSIQSKYEKAQREVMSSFIQRAHQLLQH